jgi:predicted DNA-binding ribbon-helix-helix protein
MCPHLDLDALYEQDIALWSDLMVELLRQGKFDQLDLEHLIEEVSDLGRRERDRLVSSIRLIVHHLLKWQFQPERHFPSRVKTIQRERINIESNLADTLV